MAADTKDAFNTAHAGTLVIGSQDLFFLRFGIPTPRIEHTALVAILTPKLLAAAGVMTVLDDV
jgi:arginine exporter protein ArgO